MKKEIVTMLLVAALMTSSLTACTEIETAGNNTDNTPTESTITEAPKNQPESETTSTQDVELSPTKYELTLGSQTFQFDTTPQQTLENFISELIGYTFVFDDLMAFIGLFKTENGGATWNQQNIDQYPDLDDSVICAKMLDENVGCIFVRYWADDCISKRTYITTDGGKTWKSVVLPANGPYVDIYDSNEAETCMCSTEAYDFLYENEIYIIYFRQKEYTENNYPYHIYFQYSSTDLINWTFVEK